MTQKITTKVTIEKTVEMTKPRTIGGSITKIVWVVNAYEKKEDELCYEKIYTKKFTSKKKSLFFKETLESRYKRMECLSK